MRLRTAVAVLAVLALLGTVVVVGLGLAPTGGSMEVAWVSDTPRDNVRNHHAVGVGPDDDLVVAPVTEVPGDDVEMTARSCALVRLSPANGSVLWRATTPPTSCFSHALTEPAIADVDGDGGPEVLSASTEDALVAYDGRTGAEEWRVPLSTYGYGHPTVVPGPDGAGADVVASDIGGTVVRVAGNGSVRWRVDLARTVERPLSVTDAPRVADVTGDGDAEVVVGSNRGVVVLSGDGDRVRTRSVPATYVATGPAREDGGRTILTAYYRSVQAVDGASGELLWRRNVTNGRVRGVTDADADGTPEVHVGRVGGEVLALDADTGATEWATTVAVDDDAIVPPPVTADVTGDGRPEVIAVTEVGRVAVLDPVTGEELATYEREVPIWTFATPADLDDDGDREVLVRYGDGRVVALQYTAADRPLAAPVAAT